MGCSEEAECTFHQEAEWGLGKQKLGGLPRQRWACLQCVQLWGSGGEDWVGDSYKKLQRKVKERVP